MEVFRISLGFVGSLPYNARLRTIPVNDSKQPVERKLPVK